MTPFLGLSAFPITPSDPDGRVVQNDFARILRHAVKAGVDSICVLGSTGGYAYLDPDQRRRAADDAVAEIAGRVPVMVGVGALRTDVSKDLARHATAAGADALLVAPMSYTPLTDDEVFAHYAAIAGASDLPICIYNNPTTTHFSFGPDLLMRLATIPSIRAVKMPLPAQDDFAAEIARLRDSLPKGFSIGYSGDWGCGAAMLSDADAFYSAAAGAWPAPMLRLVRSAQAGNTSETARMDAAFQPLWALFRRFGSFRVVYRAANLLRLSDAQPPRPILPLPSDQDDVLCKAMAALDAL
ncbi:dihydrodipicolinate synthase family protein [Paracoccus sediminis]|uniref:4-hydroxy-tetrahydrodipicolinate synthase n=1 Tax=Paracoccus sediminis TaxID=1214787 RepID=A0A238WW51_9RHOB|nr:dihydrodipicolinate synthase family protein [Paracoccus sediminis]TBN50061.1 dihydrodipicolinate synthase family protein [Paracoccus sediminis]SNR50698.1 4-hydroxy-tetrahydrodipicolinate synthase [Paracoccus sediminis]